MRVKKSFLGKLMVLFLVVGMFAGVVPETTYAASTESISVSGTYNYSMANSVLSEVNSQRSKNGRSKLTMDSTLTKQAMQRAAELSCYYSHTRPNGSNYKTAYSKLGNSYGENIAAGYTSASQVMKAWMGSAGHKANILSKNYNTIGIGSFTNGSTTYWVEIFSSSSGSSSSKSGSVNTTVSVSVKSSNISGCLTLTPASSSINKGKTTGITVYLKNKGASGFKTKINNSSLKWSSNSTSVATVNSSGTVTGKKAGSVKITAKTKNGGASASTTITVKDSGKKSISSCSVSLSKTSYTYDGTAKKPTVTVKDGSKTLKSGTDYSVSYKNNTKVGTASVIITGKGNYTGSVTKTFTIKKGSTSTTTTTKPATTSISSLKSSASGQMTVKWNKVSGVGGYVLYYSESPKFSSSGSYDTKGYEIWPSDSYTSHTFTKMEKGKTYYVRMQTYQKINGKKTYSDWSSVKSVTIAK